MGLPSTIPNPPLVPSKSALRALRRLAFSPSILAVGAFSSICGLAAVDYNVCSKIRVAQQIIETKKVLQAISPTKTSSHLQHMFDTAERGEDFTIQSMNARRGHRTQRPVSTGMQSKSVQDHKRQNADESEESNGSIHEKQEKDCSSSAIHVDFYNGPYKASRPINLLEARHLRLSRKRPTSRTMIDGRRFYSMRAELVSRQFEIAKDHRPPWTSKFRRPRRTLALQTEIDGPVLCNAMSLAATRHHSTPGNDSELLLNGLELALDSEECNEIIEFISGMHWCPSMHPGPDSWLSVLRYFKLQGTEKALETATGWLLKYRTSFSLGLCTSPEVLAIVQWLFNDRSRHQYASEILFPSASSSHWNDLEATNKSLLAVAYLKYFAESCQSFEQLTMEFEKVFQAAETSNTLIGEEVLLPVIQGLCDRQQFDNALLIMDEARHKYKLSITQDSLEILTQSYGSVGNWKAAMATLEISHTMGFSRIRPIQFQRLYAKLITQYSTNHSAESCLSFTGHALRIAGLVPSPRVSIPLICVSIKEGRHDLITEWGRLVDKVYCRMGLPFRTMVSALRFSETCLSIGASCAEIAGACRAIAHSAREDPFGSQFRFCVWELVRTDLLYRLQAINDVQKILPENFHRKSTADLLRLAGETVTTTARSSTRTLEEARLQARLQTQLTAIDELKQIFAGAPSMTNLYGSAPDQQTSVNYLSLRRPVEPKLETIDLHPPPPPELSQALLPPYPAIFKTLIARHAHNVKEGRTEDHSLLKSVTDKLMSAGREADALRLLGNIHDSEVVQGLHGTPYDEALFLRWLRLVDGVRARNVAAKVLWAVLDTVRHLEYGLVFGLAVLNVSVTEFRKKSGFGDQDWDQNDSVGRELNYLYHRFVRVAKTKQLHAADVEFPPWVGWEEAARQKAAMANNVSQH